MSLTAWHEKWSSSVLETCLNLHTLPVSSGGRVRVTPLPIPNYSGAPLLVSLLGFSKGLCFLSSQVVN